MPSTTSRSRHEPEALGISKVLCKPSPVSAICFLHYALPQVAKLSRSLQVHKLDLTAIVPLVDTTLNTLDDAILPTANYTLELLNKKDDLEAATDIKITTERITSFQDRVAKPFITMLKNIYRVSLFHKIVSPHLASLIRRKCQLQTLQACYPMGRTQWTY